MKKLLITSALATLGFIANAQSHKAATHKPVNATQQALRLANFDDSVSYALGISMAEFYQQQGMKNINTNLLAHGIRTVVNKDSALFSDEQVGAILNEAMQKYMTEKADAAKKEGADFMARNKTNPNVVTMPDGLQYQILKQGNGQVPTDTNSVKVNYTGTLLNGTEFDNSYKRGQPLDINVSGVIRGWTEALELMPVGSKWRVWIPSDLGYGDRGAGRDIPPGATLQFDIELIGINK